MLYHWLFSVRVRKKLREVKMLYLYFWVIHDLNDGVSNKVMLEVTGFPICFVSVVICHH